MNYFHRAYLIAAVLLLGLSSITASQHYITTTVSEALERLPQDQKLTFLDDSYLILKKNWPITDLASTLVNEHPLITLGGACIIGYYAWKGFWKTSNQITPEIPAPTNVPETVPTTTENKAEQQTTAGEGQITPEISTTATGNKTEHQTTTGEPQAHPGGILNDTGAACYRNAALQGIRFLAPEIYKLCQEKEQKQAVLSKNQTFQDFKNFMKELGTPTKKVINLPTDFPHFADLLSEYVPVKGRQDDASTILLGLGSDTLKEGTTEDDKKAQAAISTIMHTVMGIRTEREIIEPKENIVLSEQKSVEQSISFDLRQNSTGTLASLVDLITNSYTADEIQWTTKAPTKNAETGKDNNDGEFISAIQNKTIQLTGSKGLAFLIPVYKKQKQKFPIPEIPLHLQLKDTLKSSKPANEKEQPKVAWYQLKSIVCHKGGLPGGHYIAYINHNNTWYYCSDSTVETANIAGQASITKENLATGFAPYLIFYEKIEN